MVDFIPHIQLDHLTDHNTWTCSGALRVCVPTCLAGSRAYVLGCLHAHVLTCLHAFHVYCAQMFYGLRACVLGLLVSLICYLLYVSIFKLQNSFIEKFIYANTLNIFFVYILIST